MQHKFHGSMTKFVIPIKVESNLPITVNKTTCYSSKQAAVLWGLHGAVFLSSIFYILFSQQLFFFLGLYN